MKKRYLVAALLSMSIALPAVAGPDWQVIHDAEFYSYQRAMHAAAEKKPSAHAEQPAHKLAEHKPSELHNQPHG